MEITIAANMLAVFVVAAALLIAAWKGESPAGKVGWFFIGAIGAIFAVAVAVALADGVASLAPPHGRNDPVVRGGVIAIVLGALGFVFYLLSKKG